MGVYYIKWYIYLFILHDLMLHVFIVCVRYLFAKLKLDLNSLLDYVYFSIALFKNRLIRYL